MLKCFLFFLIFFCSCGYDDYEDYEYKPLPIDLKELTYKKGDCIVFNIDNGRHIVGGK